MRAITPALLAVLTALLLLPASASADLGDPDPAFATAGATPSGVRLPAAVQGEVADLIADGSGGFWALVGVGSAGLADPELWKLTALGALDTSWSGDGRLPLLTELDTTNDRQWAFKTLGLNPGGSVYVAGSVNGTFGGENGQRLAVLKLKADGTRDETFDGFFGGNGLVAVGGDIDQYTGHSVVALGNGVVVGGNLVISTQSGGSSRLGAIVLKSDGNRNPDYSTDGAIPGLLVAATGGDAYDLAVVDGKIVASGRLVVTDPQTKQAAMRAAIVRWEEPRQDPDSGATIVGGQRDQSFGTDGVAAGPADLAQWDAMRVQGDQITVGTSAYFNDTNNGGFAVGRYDGAGDPVDAFGDDGIVRSAIGTSNYASVGGLEVQPGGGVVVAGQIRDHGGAYRMYWRRFTETGARDMVFAGGGRAFGDSSSAQQTVAATALSGTSVVLGGLTYGPVGAGDTPVARPSLVRLRNARSAPEPEYEPYIGGGSEVGEVMNTSDGGWHGYGTISYEYAWQRCTSEHAATTNIAAAGDCTTVAGNALERTLVEADAGKYMRAIVTAVNDVDQEAKQASATSAKVTDVAPHNNGLPTFAPSGTTTVGQTFTVTAENFGGTNLVYEINWLRCLAPSGPNTCFVIPDPANPQKPINAESYTATAEDADKWISVQIFARNNNGSAYGASMDRTFVSSSGSGATAPTVTAAPAIGPAGAVTEGDTLRETSAATFAGTAPITAQRQWQRCGGTAAAPSGCTAIGGATGDTYVTTSADAGRVVRLRTTGTNAAGAATADSTARQVNERQAAPVQPRPTPQPDAPAPVDTRHTTKMPNVLGKNADQAIDAIAKAGIFADVKVDARARQRPLKLKGKALDPGQVHSQSVAAGGNVVSAIGQKANIKLVVEAGQPGFKGCTAGSFTRELRGIDLEQSWAMLKEKGCASRVNWDFKVAGSGDEPEVRSASKDGRELQVIVTVPKDQSQYDLFPFHGQGAYLNDPTPSFGIDDLALTAGDQNVFGVRVFDRYIGDEKQVKGARRVIGAKVYVDADSVGAEDQERTTREDTGSMAIFGSFRPTKAGTVRYLVQAQDARGNKIFGFSQFPVKKRSGKFQTISGESWNASPAGISLASRAKNQARAASLDQMWKWAQDAFRSGPLNALANAGRTATEGLIALAKRGAGPVIYAASGIANALTRPISLSPAQVVSSGGANVVSAGGANVVSAGGANAVSAGGANIIGQAAGNILNQNNAGAVSAGGANMIGLEKVVSGTGSVRVVPLISENGLGLISDNGLGLLSDNGLGLQGMSKIIAPSDAATVRATSGANIIGSAAYN